MLLGALSYTIITGARVLDDAITSSATISTGARLLDNTIFLRVLSYLDTTSLLAITKANSLGRVLL